MIKTYILKRFFLLVIVMVFSTTIVLSQNRCSYILPEEASNIILVPDKIIHTNKEGEEVISKGYSIPFSKGNGAISTHSGELLLICNGKTLFGNDFQPLNNGGVEGNSGSAQSAIFVPLNFDKEVSEDKLTHQFFVFTTDIPNRIPIEDLKDKGLHYSLIEYNASEGYYVRKKNINLLPHCTEKIAAIKKKNSNGMWVIAHGWGDNNFYIYDATDTTTITAPPRVQSIGYVHNYTDSEIDNPLVYESQNSTGVMKISPDGTRLAVALTGDGIVEIFDFDSETGVLSNPITLSGSEDNILLGAFGVEFSPEGEYLYVTATHSQLGGIKDNELIQFDIKNNTDAVSILQSAVVINDDMEKDVQGLQLTAGRRILVSHEGGAFIGRIDNPERKGTLCNYHENAIEINQVIGAKNVTTFPANFLDIPVFIYDMKCYNDVTTFEVVNPLNIDNITWDFGDADGVSDISDFMHPTHEYSQSGTYWVTMDIESEGIHYVYTDSVIIHELPRPDLGEDRFVISESSVELYPGNYYAYDWLDLGSTDSVFYAHDSGEYIVRVEDDNCCINSDTIMVSMIKLNLPNAINPTSIIQENRVFKIKEGIEGITDYEMFIFNRWGQMLFASNDIATGWNGTYDNKLVPVGSYTYLIKFNLLDENLQKKAVIKKGMITVVK